MVSILDKINAIEKIDKGNMRQLLTDFPMQAEEAINIGKKASLSDLKTEKIENIIILGMGGSAIGGDLIKCVLLERIKVPIIVNRNYTLPAFVSEKSLIFACSYSGNTEETLSALNLAKKRKAKIIALSSNGELEKIAEREKFDFIKIPSGFPPRCALGYSFFPVLLILSRLKLVEISTDELEETIDILKQIEKEINPKINMSGNTAKKIALKLFKKMVVIYGWADFYEVAAYRFRCQLAENSKNFASHHLMPEMNHNEIMAWHYPESLLRKIEVVFLMDKAQHEKITKRIDILAPVIEKKAGGITNIFTKGESLLAKIFSLIYTCDFISFYLAILNKVNPTPVDTISYLKERLMK
ncbi:MAG: bifunctional phosphoglucose/phosphomannose isomerase [Candidatus Omnitrophota bacterium]